MMDKLITDFDDKPILVLLQHMQWNLDITKGEGTGKMSAITRFYCIEVFFFQHFTIAGAKLLFFVTKRTLLYRDSLNQGSTVHVYIQSSIFSSRS